MPGPGPEGAGAGRATSSVPGEGATGSTPTEQSGLARYFDTRHIPEFSGTGDNISEWFVRAEKLCRRRGVDFTDVLPERLTGAAFAVWEQLSEQAQGSLEDVRAALYDAFAPNRYVAFAAFQARELRQGESPDAYLADLRRLMDLVISSGEVFPESVMATKFVSGLPLHVRTQLKAGTRVQAVELTELVRVAREILSDDSAETTAVVAAAQQQQQQQQSHLRPSRRPRRCWTCGSESHLAARCPKGRGDGASAQAPSPERQ